jgi:hypothetical protein
MSLLYQHQQCLDTIEKVAAFEAGLDESTRGLFKNYNPALMLRRGTLNIAAYGKRKLRSQDFQPRSDRTLSDGTTFYSHLLRALRNGTNRNGNVSLTKARKEIKQLKTQNHTYSFVKRYLDPEILKSIISTYASRLEMQNINIYEYKNLDLGVRVTPEWITAVKLEYIDSAETELDRAQAALDNFEEESPGYFTAACQTIQACIPYNVEIKGFGKTAIIGVDLKTPDDFKTWYGWQQSLLAACQDVQEPFVSRPCSSMFRSFRDMVQVRREALEALLSALAKFFSSDSTRKRLRKQLRYAQQKIYFNKTCLKLVEEFHTFPESVAPLTNPQLFPDLSNVAIYKKLLMYRSAYWHAPPTALSRFREAIVAADKSFLKTRRSNGTLTEDPFFIELHCDDQMCTINGTVVAVPHCKIRVDGYYEDVVIDFVEDVYDGLYRFNSSFIKRSYKDAEPHAVTIKKDGSASFHAQGKVFHDLLYMWNSEPELTVSEILGVSKGRCIFCHRPLSLNSSKEQGFGDVCKKKFEESIRVMRGTIEHSVDHDGDVVAGVDVQPSNKTKVHHVPQLNGHEIPQIVIDKSPVLKDMAEDFEDVSMKIEGLLGVDRELLLIVASWLQSKCIFFPSRAGEVMRLCHKLAIPHMEDLVQKAKPLVVLSL